MGIFLEWEDSHGDHSLGRLVEFRFKAPPGTTSSTITTHIPSGQLTAPNGRPSLRSRLHSCHAQEGGPRSPQRTCGGHWKKKLGEAGPVYLSCIQPKILSISSNAMYHLWHPSVSYRCLPEVYGPLTEDPLPMLVPCPLAVTTACCLDRLCVSYGKLRCSKPSSWCVEARSIGWCALDSECCVNNWNAVKTSIQLTAE